jgi:hypothetical protein
MQKKLDDDGEPWSDEKLMQVDAISFSDSAGIFPFPCAA